MSSQPRIELLVAAGVVDGAGTAFAPGALLMEHSPGSLRVLAVGRPNDVAGHEAAKSAIRKDVPGTLLIPALVNAHTHLDLTHLGPQMPAAHADPDEAFRAFVAQVRAGRRTDAAGVAASVRDGAARSLAGGVVAVGDIAGSPGAPSLLAYDAIQSLPPDLRLAGVSFVEFFAIGNFEARGLAALDSLLAGADRNGPLQLGLSPHAPYSCSASAYRHAAGLAERLDLPLCTHLSETPGELELVATGGGPQRRFLESIGAWSDGCAQGFTGGLRPIQHLAPVLRDRPMLLAHVNSASDEDIEVLAAAGATVVYCPRASAWFGFESAFGPHRYRDMVAAGVAVCLGTDSILNLGGQSVLGEAAKTRISTWDEMRLLHQRDGTDPVYLLDMATRRGAAALGLDPAVFTFEAGGPVAGVVGVSVGDGESPSDGRGLLGRALRAAESEVRLLGRVE